MDLNRNGKRALVTDSSSGLGEAIVKMLAREGAAVVVHGRDGARVTAIAQVIAAYGGRVAQALGDLSTRAGADAACEQALADGPIDILVNNAGYYGSRNWADTPEDEWLDAYNANVVSGVRMIKRLVPSMRESGWGRVIQIGGGLAQQPMALQPEYNATLAARHNLAVSLARDLRNTGVTSNIVSPGAIRVGAIEGVLRAASGPHPCNYDLWKTSMLTKACAAQCAAVKARQCSASEQSDPANATNCGLPRREADAPVKMIVPLFLDSVERATSSPNVKPPRQRARHIASKSETNVSRTGRRKHCRRFRRQLQSDQRHRFGCYESDISVT